MTIKYLIDLKTFTDVRALDAMFWHEHGFEVVDDIEEPIVAKYGRRSVIGSRDGSQNAAKGIERSERAAHVYGQGTCNSLK